MWWCGGCILWGWRRAVGMREESLTWRAVLMPFISTHASCSLTMPAHSCLVLCRRQELAVSIYMYICIYMYRFIYIYICIYICRYCTLMPRLILTSRPRGVCIHICIYIYVYRHLGLLTST